MVNSSPDCVIAGGGPAGLVAGLLLARAGVRVTVLEKHADFLRDFRGDTVHASTLQVLEDVGLGPAFRKLPHRDVESIDVELGVELDAETDAELDADRADTFVLADFRRLPGRFRHISLVPQWDLLDLLAGAAAREPGFELRREWEVTGLIREGDRVAGVRARTPDGTEHDVPARLTIAADGRGSVLRRAAGLPVRAFGVPIDVLWFRLPLQPGDPETVRLRIGASAMAVLIRRETHWQCALLVPKGGAGALTAGDAAALRHRFGALVPAFAARSATLRAADVSVLDVRLDRLRRWWRPGLLCIGDAAHAMSPVAGVGINLAVADAVAAANRLAGPLRSGGDVDGLLAGVQRRRTPPVVLVQAVQRAAHAGLLGPVAAGRPFRLPLPIRVVRRVPALQRVLGRLVGIGLRPERPAGPAGRVSPG